MEKNKTRHTGSMQKGNKVKKLIRNEGTKVKHIRKRNESNITWSICLFKLSLKEEELQLMNQPFIPLKSMCIPFPPCETHKTVRDHTPKQLAWPINLILYEQKMSNLFLDSCVFERERYPLTWIKVKSYPFMAKLHDCLLFSPSFWISLKLSPEVFSTLFEVFASLKVPHLSTLTKVK